MSHSRPAANYRDRIPGFPASFAGSAKVDGGAQTCEIGCGKSLPTLTVGTVVHRPEGQL
jgi:hypothetical protein